MAVLYLMVGIPGAGKTTWAKAQTDCVYLGSDELRRRLYGREMTPRGYRKIHRIMAREAAAHLSVGQNVVVDSAHISRNSRRKLLKLIPSDVKRVAVFIDTPLKQALENNQHRNRHVPEPGIRFLKLRLRPPEQSEGFDKILYIRNTQEKQGNSDIDK